MKVTSTMNSRLTVSNTHPSMSGNAKPVQASQHHDLEHEATVPPLQLHRESHVAKYLAAQSGTSEVSAIAEFSGDDRRPHALSAGSHEQRQILALSRLVCQATIEALAGRRPVHQLRSWVEPELLSKIQHRADLASASNRQHGSVKPLQFLSERQIRVASGAWEASIVFCDSSRTRACALRLQAHRQRWRVVAMELG